MKKMDKIERLRKLFMGLLGVLLLAGLLLSIWYGTMDYRGFHITRCSRITDSFQVSWGSERVETTLPGSINNPVAKTITIRKVLHKDTLGNGDSILFRNRQSRVKVYLDEDMLYDSGEAFQKPFSLGYGSLWKSLAIGSDYDGRTLTIELEPGYRMAAVSGYLPAVYFGTQASFIAMIAEKTFLILILTLILIGMGMYDISYGLFAIHKKKSAQLFYLGLFSVDTGLWLLIESHFLELFMHQMQCIIYLSYFTYGMMPVLLIRFLLCYEEFKDKFYLNVLCFAGIWLNLFQFIMAATETYSLFESQWLNRIYLIFTVLGLLLALVSVRKVEQQQERRKLYGGIFILVVSTILELFYFVFISKENSGRILILGLCLFIFKAGIDLIREGRRIRRDDFEKEILQNMAYTDSMTRLGNRYAYEQEKERLKKCSTTVTVLVADMNGLKQANDHYGHGYGDQIIRETARIMKESFEHIGICFRIGGDEFCVLASQADPQEVENAIEKMKEEAAMLQNDMQNYGIAYGVVTGTAGDIDDIFREADDQMYVCKKKMKEKRADR